MLLYVSFLFFCGDAKGGSDSPCLTQQASNLCNSLLGLLDVGVFALATTPVEGKLQSLQHLLAQHAWKNNRKDGFLQTAGVHFNV